MMSLAKPHIAISTENDSDNSMPVWCRSRLRPGIQESILFHVNTKPLSTRIFQPIVISRTPARPAKQSPLRRRWNPVSYFLLFIFPFHWYLSKSIISIRSKIIPSFSSRVFCSSYPYPRGSDIRPCRLITLCHGSPSFLEQEWRIRATWRAPRGSPAIAAICPYVATLPRGIALINLFAVTTKGFKFSIDTSHLYFFLVHLSIAEKTKGTSFTWSPRKSICPNYYFIKVIFLVSTLSPAITR